MHSDYRKTAHIFKALADENRLKILDMLAAGSLCSCRMVPKLDISQPTLSHHLKVLHQAGLIDYQKCGKQINYRIRHEAMDIIQQFLNNVQNDNGRCGCYQE